VKGDPRPTIKWTKQGQEIKTSDRSKYLLLKSNKLVCLVILEHLQDGTLTLTIKNCTFDDTNEYRCEAENEFGSVSFCNCLDV
jgi:hypothetical protein